jgi:predicted ferric reductase
VLMWDGYIKYGPANILVPFNSEYRPVWVGIGQIAFYISALVVASFYAKKHIGHKAWRLIHYVSFITFLMVTLHGVQAGTDTNTSAMQIVYIASMSIVLFLTVMRILTAKLAKAPSHSPNPAQTKRLPPQRVTKP